MKKQKQMNLEVYNKLVAEAKDLDKQAWDMQCEASRANKRVDSARKEIRNQVKSTFKSGKYTAVMKLGKRVLNLRINKYSVIVTENSKEIGCFTTAYQAEFAFATGQI